MGIADEIAENIRKQSHPTKLVEVIGGRKVALLDVTVHTAAPFNDMLIAMYAGAKQSGRVDEFFEWLKVADDIIHKFMDGESDIR